MNLFEQQLLRLKECLQVTKDQEVASALGMSKAAFSNRKQSNSFPEEKVVQLKERLPSLDVMYVLTGARWDAAELSTHEFMFSQAATLGDVQMRKAVAGGAKNHAQALQDAANDPQVRHLLGWLIFCDRDAIDQVIRLAARLRGQHPMPFRDRVTGSSSLPHSTDSSTVIWAKKGAGKDIDGTVEKLAAAGKRVMVLASREAGPSALVVDERHRSKPQTSGAVKGLSSKETVGMTATRKRAMPATHVEGVTNQQSRARAKAKPHRA